MLENRHTSLREITSELGNGYATAAHSRVKFAYETCRSSVGLNFGQKQYQKTTAENMISEANNNPISIKCIITGDKTWVYEFDIKTS